MSKVYVFLADGFEEIEGLTVVDILRRAGVEVTTVSIMGKKTIVGAHKITLEADEVFLRRRYVRSAWRNARYTSSGRTSVSCGTSEESRS